MRFRSFRAVLGALALAALMPGLASVARATDVLAQISVRNSHRPGRYYGRMFLFPENTRNYTTSALFGYSFRQELPGGAVRDLEVGRVRTRGAYLLITDLFANGRLSTMSHTVVMMFPRVVPGTELYRVEEDPTGDLHLLAPDGSHLWIDGETARVKETRDFALAAQGSIGTPPGFRHRGLHLAIHAVGKSPFLRGTPVVMEDRTGSTCRLETEELFVYGNGPESDVFRYEDDAALFRFLSRRCPSLALPRPGTAEPGRPAVAMASAASTAAAPVLVPATGDARAATSEVRVWTGKTGVLPMLWRFLSF